jgi:hypothetical protein
MFRILLCTAVVWAAVGNAAAQAPSDTGYKRFVARSSAPREFWKIFHGIGLGREYEVDVDHLNPYYLSGDFDGDGRYDYAVNLRHRQTRQRRLAVVRGSREVAWLDRDEQLRYPTLTAWFVHPRYESLEGGVGEVTPPPTLQGDAIIIMKVEASSSLIYWNGSRFVSYWQED